MSEQQNIETLQRAIARFNAKELEGYLDMFDRSVVFHGLSRKLKPGVAGLREYYTQLRQGFPDMRIVSEDMVASGDRIANRYVFYGTHKGEFAGVAPTGKFVVSPGIVINLFRAGKCIETWQSPDTFGFLSQIGALHSLSMK